MKSANLSFDGWFYPTLWKKNMVRFWPLWMLWCIGWLLSMPLQLLNDYNIYVPKATDDYISGAYYFSRTFVMKQLTNEGVVLLAGAALVAAMAVCSYLYQSKSAGMIHSLPVHRGGLFVTNYISGLSMLMLPLLPVYLLTALVEVQKQVLDLGCLTIWLGGTFLYLLFFYSFAVFCGQFTGHVLALPVFYGILNFLVWGLASLVDVLFQNFVFGYTTADKFYDIVLWWCPLGQLIDGVQVQYTYDELYNNILSLELEGWEYMVTYALAGLVLAVLAYLVYRRRQMETAGDVVAVHWVKPIFKYGVAISAALSIGTGIYFWQFASLDIGIPALIGTMVAMGAIGYLIALMFLEKSIKVFQRKHLIGLIPLSLVLALGGWTVDADLLGIEDYCPQAEQVASVSIQGLNSAPFDNGSYVNFDTENPQIIAEVIGLHQALINEKESIAGNPYNYAYDTEERSSTRLRLTYTLNNGNTVKRYYQEVLLTQEALDEAGSFASVAQLFLNQPSHIEQNYFPNDKKAEMADWTMVGGLLTIPSTRTGWNEAVADDLWETYGSKSVELTAEEAQLLYDAVMTDMEAGNLGQRFLLTEGSQRKEICYYNDLTFLFYAPPSDKTYADTSMEYIYESTEPMVAVDREYSDYTYEWTVTVQSTATETLAVLEELGLSEVLFLYGEVYS